MIFYFRALSFRCARRKCFRKKSRYNHLDARQIHFSYLFFIRKSANMCSPIRFHEESYVSLAFCQIIQLPSSGNCVADGTKFLWHFHKILTASYLWICHQNFAWRWTQRRCLLWVAETSSFADSVQFWRLYAFSKRTIHGNFRAEIEIASIFGFINIALYIRVIYRKRLVKVVFRLIARFALPV